MNIQNFIGFLSAFVIGIVVGWLAFGRGEDQDMSNFVDRTEYEKNQLNIERKLLEHEKKLLIDRAIINSASPEQLDSLESVYRTQFDLRGRL